MTGPSGFRAGPAPRRRGCGFLVGRQTTLSGLCQHAPQTGANERGPIGLALLGSDGRNLEPGAAERLQHVGRLQLAIGAGDRVRIDGQVAGQFADRRHEISRLEGIAGDGEFHLPHDLIVNRDAVGGVDMHKHDFVRCDRSPRRRVEDFVAGVVVPIAVY